MRLFRFDARRQSFIRFENVSLVMVECVLSVLFGIFLKLVRVCGDWLDQDLLVEKIEFFN